MQYVKPDARSMRVDERRSLSGRHSSSGSNVQFDDEYHLDNRELLAEITAIPSRRGVCEPGPQSLQG